MTEVHRKTTTQSLKPSLDMKEQDAEDDGPPPGWDNKHHLKEEEETEQVLQPAAVSVISSDMKMEDVRQDVQNEDGPQPGSEAHHPSPVPELVSSDITVDHQGSEDEGPPPGWDSRSQSEPKSQVELPSTPPSGHMEAEDVQKDAQNDVDLPPQSQAHTSQLSELVAPDMQEEQHDSEDEGPPPGWDSKSQPEPESLLARPTTPQSDIKMMDVQQDAENEKGPEPRSQAHPSPPPETVPSDTIVEQHDSEDEGPPPGWDSKCQPEPESQLARLTTPQSDIKMMNVQQDAENEKGPEPRSQAHPSPPPEAVPSDLKMDQQDSEDEGPPPGWDSKCQPGSNPATPRSDTKTEDIQQIQIEDGHQLQSLADPTVAPEPVPSDTQVEQQDSEDDGPPPGWDSKCESEPKVQEACPSNLRSDTKTGDVQLSAQNEDGPERQSLSRPIPT